MLGLLVRKEFIDKILRGEKTWEVRRTRTRVRGRIALVWGGKVWGTVEIVDVVELPVEEMARRREHGVPPEFVRAYGEGKERLFAWVLAHPRALDQPVDVPVPRGARVWIKLPKEVEARLWEGLEG